MTILPHLYENSVKRIPDTFLVIFETDLRGEGTRFFAHSLAKTRAFPDLWKAGDDLFEAQPGSLMWLWINRACGAT